MCKFTPSPARLAFSVPMDSIKLSKNFTLSRESIKETLAAFKVNKSTADVTKEVF
ncbi:hypothetical protein MANES_05G079850v8 [Manihot esculenta]|uniref:Uncharacterized protein n=1 Tax=Manihot esculenta TaxID=3983 RepID=A0ACB7HQ24_MANES|nr:hypothetical protein MANES_05G079850v8 [Manihot esculenta]